MDYGDIQTRHHVIAPILVPRTNFANIYVYKLIPTPFKLYRATEMAMNILLLMETKRFIKITKTADERSTYKKYTIIDDLFWLIY